jgi:hypothetical protein
VGRRGDARVVELARHGCWSERDLAQVCGVVDPLERLGGRAEPSAAELLRLPRAFHPHGSAERYQSVDYISSPKLA